jgi:signal transduction histidine kinase
MADRIAALGGELRVSSRAGSGTTISGRIPLRPG